MVFASACLPKVDAGLSAAVVARAGSASWSGLPANSTQPWSKARRIRLASEFAHIHRKGRRKAGTHLVVKTVTTQGPCSRLAVVTSRKVGHAVWRNSWRRKVRELFRKELMQRLDRQRGCCSDCLVIVTCQGRSPSSLVLRQELIALLDLEKGC